MSPGKRARTNGASSRNPMSANPIVHRTTAVLKMPGRKSNVAAFATSVINAMTGNASFPSPTPPLATVSADLAAYEAAEALVLTRVKGAAVTRNAKYLVLHTDLQHLMGYAQQVADADPVNAQSILESAGFSVRKTVLQPKSALKVEAGSVPGSVKLTAKAVDHRASYEWQYSTDQKTWTNAPSTLPAKTVITGLTSGTVYSFRVRGVTKTGEGPFSQVVQILVS
jgi:Fibronectin type III domain